MKKLPQSNYRSALQTVRRLKEKYGESWNAIQPENAARMVAQNHLKTGLDIAIYTAAIMRKDMAEYDADSSAYTQSLGCWHGFVAQQKMIAVKKHHQTTNKKYLYLSGWMVAAMRSEFGPLPDQSMHEKTAVSSLIKEIYDFLRQADAIELNDDAYEQTVENFENSDWGDRLFCYHASLQEFVDEIDDEYDLIISNPPFYTSTYKEISEERAMARHTESLTYHELLGATSKLLSEIGSCAFIIPFSEEEIAIASPEELGKLIRNLKAKISSSELETINQKLAASLRSTPNCKKALRFHICKLRMIVATKQ